MPKAPAFISVTDEGRLLDSPNNILAVEYIRAIYNLDSKPVKTEKWTELPNVRMFFKFFMEHKEEFEK